MRSQTLIAILLSTACIEVEPKQDSGECEAPMAPYDAVSPDLSREPQTLGVHAAPLVDTFEHEIHVAPWGLDGASGRLFLRPVRLRLRSLRHRAPLPR